MAASVLFVCLGNICRSPAAEGVARAVAAREGWDIRIDSAGTYGGHAGSLPDARMRAAAARRGYDLVHRARQVQPADGNDFAMILAMDHANLRALRSLGLAGAPKVALLGSFLPGEPEVPDPYYGGSEGFEEVLDLLERAVPLALRAAQA